MFFSLSLAPVLFFSISRLLSPADGETYPCITSSALNTHHQFRCCYTSRNPKCQNLCIDNRRVCDGTPDCPDARDEWSSLCSQTCPLGYEEFKGFLCKRAWRRCLSFNRFCDEEFDCSDSGLEDRSDESDCECYHNKDCPFYGNISATLPPAPTVQNATPDAGPQTDKTLVVVVFVIIAILVVIVAVICAFLIKSRLDKGKLVNNPSAQPLAHPSAPSSSSSSQPLSSPPQRSAAVLRDYDDSSYVDAPPPYDEIETASPGTTTASTRPRVS